MTDCSGTSHSKKKQSSLGQIGDYTYRKSVEVYENSDDLYKIVIQNLTEKEHLLYLDKLDEAKVEYEELDQVGANSGGNSLAPIFLRKYERSPKDKKV